MCGEEAPWEQSKYIKVTTYSGKNEKGERPFRNSISILKLRQYSGKNEKGERPFRNSINTLKLEQFLKMSVQ